MPKPFLLLLIIPIPLLVSCGQVMLADSQEGNQPVAVVYEEEEDLVVPPSDPAGEGAAKAMSVEEVKHILDQSSSRSKP